MGLELSWAGLDVWGFGGWECLGKDRMLGVGGWWVRAEGLEVGSRMLIWIWIAQSFVSLRFKTVASWCVVASRLSSSCTQKRITKAELSVLWSATSVVQTSGEEASPSHEQHTQLRTLQRYDTCTRLPSQRSPCCRSPSLMGEASKTQQRLTKTDSRQKKSRQLPISPDRGILHPRRQSHLTQLSFV